ncbi:MAG: acetyl-CoA carboxylase carboxyl transferase subunit alpha, partial [Chitinophagales bacterium]
MVFLDFEQPIADLLIQLDKLQKVGVDGDISVSASVKQIKQKIKSKRKEIYAELSPWQKVQVARHPDRPYTLDYIKGICSEFEEFHGDRNFGDDHAIVGGLGKIDGQSVM